MNRYPQRRMSEVNTLILLQARCGKELKRSGTIVQFYNNSSLAQLAERTTVNRDVSGSIPLGRANVCNSVVECRDFLTRSSLVRSQSYVKNYLKILRSLMARICGFHPQDPGSIPGVEVCPGMTLKAFHMFNACTQEV